MKNIQYKEINVRLIKMHNFRLEARSTEHCTSWQKMNQIAAKKRSESVKSFKTLDVEICFDILVNSAKAVENNNNHSRLHLHVIKFDKF